MVNLPWAESKVYLLEKLWADGDTASEIAAKLDVSRNAVLGKVHRLKLPPRLAGRNINLELAKRLGLVPRRMKPRRAERPEPTSVTIVTRDGNVGIVRQKPEGWTKPITRAGTSKTSPEYRNQLGLAPEMTPNQRRNFLAEAVRNTQAMQRS